MTSFSITADKITKMFLKDAAPKLKKGLDELYMGIQMLSPVRTGAYISQHRNLGVRHEGYQLIGEIMNQGDYPERVEFGFGKGGGIGNRTTSVQWHLRNGQIYIDKGAHTYQRALLKFKPRFNTLLG